MMNVTLQIEVIKLKMDCAGSCKELWNIYDSVHEILVKASACGLVSTNDLLYCDSCILKYLEKRINEIFDTLLEKEGN